MHGGIRKQTDRFEEMRREEAVRDENGTDHRADFRPGVDAPPVPSEQQHHRHACRQFDDVDPRPFDRLHLPGRQRRDDHEENHRHARGEHIVPRRLILPKEAFVHVRDEVRSAPAQVRVHRAHEGRQEGRHEQTPEPVGHHLGNHHRIRQLGVGGEVRSGGAHREDDERTEPRHDPRPGHERPCEGKPERRKRRLLVVLRREEALRHITVVPAPCPEHEDETEVREKLERADMGRVRDEIERTRRRVGERTDLPHHLHRTADLIEDDPGENQRADDAHGELQEVGGDHAP